MKIIYSDNLHIRTYLLVCLLTYAINNMAQNPDSQLTFTLRNASLKEFVKLIDNSTG